MGSSRWVYLPNWKYEGGGIWRPRDENISGMRVYALEQLSLSRYADAEAAESYLNHIFRETYGDGRVEEKEV